MEKYPFPEKCLPTWP